MIISKITPKISNKEHDAINPLVNYL